MNRTWLVFPLVIGACVDAEQVSSVEQEAGQTVFHSTWNSGSAAVDFGDYMSWGFAEVTQFGTGPNRSVQMYFYRSTPDETSWTCTPVTGKNGEVYQDCFYTRFTFENGWGVIPTADAVFKPKLVQVDTQLGANFFGERCTLDYMTGLYSCVPLAGGRVAVTWLYDGMFRESYNGVHQSSFGAYTSKSQGQWKSSSAHATGVVLGTSFTDAWGRFSDSKGTNVGKYIISGPLL